MRGCYKRGFVAKFWGAVLRMAKPNYLCKEVEISYQIKFKVVFEAFDEKIKENNKKLVSKEI